MPHHVIEHRVFLASPSDVASERELLAQAVDEWNGCVGRALGLRLALVRWEAHSIPDASKPPQSAINSQLLDAVDIGVAVFGSRLGAPTSNAESGTVEEIDQLLAAGRPVLVYFRDTVVSAKDSDSDMTRLMQYREELSKRGLVSEFKDAADLRHRFFLHVTAKVLPAAMQARGMDVTRALSTPAVLTAPKPDVRLKVTCGKVISLRSQPDSVIQVRVENHSPAVVFGGSLNLILSDGSALFAPRDSVTGEWQTSRQILPGESYSFRYSPEEVHDKAEGRKIEAVVFTDDVDRRYEAPLQQVSELNEFLSRNHMPK